MARSDVTFIRGEGGLGRPLLSNDNYSGIVFYSDTLPSGFGASDRIKQVTSLAAAEALGVVDTHADETKATGGNVEITTAAIGDTDTITITPTGGTAITLGSFTQTTAVATDSAVGLRAAINALTTTHGFSAAGAGANVLLTAPAKYGIRLNGGTQLAFATDGTGAANLTQFSGGVGSKIAPMHYHVQEFFRMSPKGTLYIGVYAEPGTFDADEITLMQTYADGEIRQFGIYLPSETFASSQLTTIKVKVDALQVLHTPCVVLHHADYSAATLSSTADLTALDAQEVAMVIGQDGDNIGYDLFYATGISISTLGNQLGTLSSSVVSESVARVNKFNLATGDELDVAAFANGDVYKDQTSALLTALTDKGYSYIRKLANKVGTWYDNEFTAITETSDYHTLSANRTIQKAERLVYAQMVELLNSPVFVDATTGKLSQDTIDLYETECDQVLDQMEADGELSGAQTKVDPDQDVLATDKVTLAIELVKVGVARTIEITSGFVTQLI